MGRCCGVRIVSARSSLDPKTSSSTPAAHLLNLAAASTEKAASMRASTPTITSLTLAISSPSDHVRTHAATL